MTAKGQSGAGSPPGTRGNPLEGTSVAWPRGLGEAPRRWGGTASSELLAAKKQIKT